MASTIVATDAKMLRNLINILSCDSPSDKIYFDTESDGPRLVGKKMLNSATRRLPVQEQAEQIAQLQATLLQDLAEVTPTLT